MCGGKNILATIFVVFVCAFVSVAASATDYYWNAGTSDWGVSGNWTPAGPLPSNGYAYIDNGGTAQISANAASSFLFPGYSHFGTIEQSGGVNTIANWLTLGNYAGGNGTYNLNTGDLLVGSSEIIGCFGAGAFNQTGGTNETNTMYFGYYATGNGSYSLSAGVLSSVNTEYIGYYGTGLFNQAGGTHKVAVRTYLGYAANADGTYNLSAGEYSVGNSEYVGYHGTGAFNQTGGTHTVDSCLYLGTYSGSDGEYNLSGGSLATGNLVINYGWLDIDCSEIDFFRVDGNKVDLLDGYIGDGKIFDSTLCPGGILYAVYDAENDWTTLQAVPEPATMALCGVALAGLAGTARRRMRKQS